MLPLSMQYGPMTAPLPLKAKAASVTPPPIALIINNLQKQDFASLALSANALASSEASDNANQCQDRLSETSDSPNRFSDRPSEVSDNANRHSDRLSEGSDSTNRHSDRLSEGSDSRRRFPAGTEYCGFCLSAAACGTYGQAVVSSRRVLSPYYLLHSRKGIPIFKS